MFTFDKHGVTQDLLLLMKGHYKVDGNIIEVTKKLLDVLFCCTGWKDYSIIDLFRVVSRSFRECLEVDPKLLTEFCDTMERDFWWTKDKEHSLPAETIIINMLNRMQGMLVYNSNGALIIDLGKPNPEIQAKLTKLDDEEKGVVETDVN